MPALDTFAAEKLARLDHKHLRRRLVDTAREDGIWVTRNGRRLLSFSCNDYLNLSQHPAVKDAAIAAIRAYGVGAGASRLVTGNHPLFAELESRLAALKGTDAACVFGSGYLANIGIIPTFAGKTDLVLVDERAHSCIWAGAEMSGATVASFRHNDLADARKILQAQRGAHRHAIIATDGVFSMDGDLAPLPALAALAHEYDAWLLSDDAHGIGVMAGGRGSTFAHAAPAHVPLQMGTLSKAIGGYGGYLCGSQSVIDLVKTKAASFVYSTGLPPSSVAAAIASLDFIAANPEYIDRPLNHARTFARALNLPEAQSPIVPIVIGAADKALKASQDLEDRGFLVVAIRPPTVPKDTARLRVAFTANHTSDDVQRLAEAIAPYVGRA
ncbi:MAG: 8-amino-7-oxononanoate synthase [Rhodospirillaceae bacterium]